MGHRGHLWTLRCGRGLWAVVLAEALPSDDIAAASEDVLQHCHAYVVSCTRRLAIQIELRNFNPSDLDPETQLIRCHSGVKFSGIP